MEAGTGIVAGLLAVVGLGCFWLARDALRSESSVVTSDDTGGQANAMVLAFVAFGLLALASAIALEGPDRHIATGTLVATAFLCAGLGWLVRYRDRRDLLTTPTVDRKTARRLGGVAMACGGLVLALVPLVWLEVTARTIAVFALGSSVVVLVAIAFAYR
ncbi:hypothetical protein OB919_19395 [Halobacteria archaeon AArc-curdl1]|uniref:Uncharacterized protein n=1 Tax=Natronosalvus hydrolyticus TaxID=2979988 RepID=A0AAP2ZBZ3_9EURY|nr:hypothetical protein [Halobacteria archaeon AArc-curdl1]